MEIDDLNLFTCIQFDNLEKGQRHSPTSIDKHKTTTVRKASRQEDPPSFPALLYHYPHQPNPIPIAPSNILPDYPFLLHLHFLRQSTHPPIAMLHHQNPTTQTPPLLLHHHHQHQQQQQQMLSPCSSSRRSSSASSSNSPEFEFWMLSNPTQPQPDLLSADQLFLDGVLLPLHLLHLNQPVPEGGPPPAAAPGVARDAPIEPSPLLIDTPAADPPSTSKRWTDIFKKSEKKSPVPVLEEKDREKQRKEKRHGTSNLAELNINLWPFSRSRSEGNDAARPRLGARVTSARRVSSAPCSRSNSGGDPKSRKWPGSPARPGVHLGRTNPVWQVKRSPRTSTDWGELRQVNKSPRGSGGSRKARVLNLNVPMCIRYRHHLSCRKDDNVGLGHATACSSYRNGGTSVPGSSSSGNMFNLRSIFTKKVH
ncbi:hypothetical protein MLD38_040588 [Melastoma candidum]|nr:hypothetical protein MLD38_040588 [Melastoma candidum]